MMKVRLHLLRNHLFQRPGKCVRHCANDSKVGVNCDHDERTVRVRFAPSPTGMLHLGGLRTAFYNFMFARKHRGKFIMRIEDTDQSRVVPEAVEKMHEILSWIGVHPDEGPFYPGAYGPYTQSERTKIYAEHVQELIKNECAYYCFCTEERLALLRKFATRHGQKPQYDNHCRHLDKQEVDERLRRRHPHVVRFMLQDSLDEFDDIVYRRIKIKITNQEGDPVILKSDGYPTYHLANVVDDHLMDVTHVLRGVEWQVSTPKHLQLYAAFGWSPPKYGHLPLLTNNDGKKFSKRESNIHIGAFKKRGYFPEALLSFISEPGGGFVDRHPKEVYDIEKLTDMFDVKKLNTNSCRLDFNRLNDLNRTWIHRCLKSTDEDKRVNDLIDTVVRLVDEKYPERLPRVVDRKYIVNVLNLVKNRIYRLNELIEDVDYRFLWTIPSTSSNELNKCGIEKPDVIISKLLEKLKDERDDDFKRLHLSESLRIFTRHGGIHYSSFMKMLRLIISGLSEGPGVAEMMEVLGKDETVYRLANIITDDPSHINCSEDGIKRDRLSQK